jgi:hypothetical protein
MLTLPSFITTIAPFGGQQLELTPKLLGPNTHPLLVKVCVTALY